MKGLKRAEYGKEVLHTLSLRLTEKYGKGYSCAALYSFKQFYARFPDPEIFYTRCVKLTWSHNRLIMRVSDPVARLYYLRQSAESNWTVRTLERNINTLYYQRLISSQKGQSVKATVQKNASNAVEDLNDFIKNPTVLEFLSLSPN